MNTLSMIRHPLCLAICGSAMLTAISGCAEKIDTVEEFVELARRHEREDSLAEAVVAYKSAIQLAPESPSLWYDLGISYDQLSQLEKALEAYSEAVKFDPEMARAYNNRATVHARLERYEEAIADCDMAIQLDPTDALAWRNRGLARHDTGDLQKALEDYNQALRINDADADTYLHRGNLYLEMEASSRALADFEAALKQAPSFATAMVSRAKALSRLDQPEAAAETLAAAERLGADISEVQLATVVAAPAPILEEFAADDEVNIVTVAQTYLQQKGIIVSAAEEIAGCDLKRNDQNVGYIIRLVRDDECVSFTPDELRQLLECSVSLSLMMLRQDHASGDVSVSAVVPNWKPDVAQMQPASWLLPINAAAPQVSTARQH